MNYGGRGYVVKHLPMSFINHSLDNGNSIYHQITNRMSYIQKHKNLFTSTGTRISNRTIRDNCS